ncbi:hypothetical protein EOL94_00340 [bacterium]|nr:hypothetical protein [bacterium]
MKKIVFFVSTFIFLIVSFSSFSQSFFSQKDKDKPFSAQEKVVEICSFVEENADSTRLNFLANTEIIQYENFVLAKNNDFLLIQEFGGGEMYIDISADGTIDRYIRNECPDQNSRTLVWNSMYAFQDLKSLKEEVEIRTSVKPVRISLLDLSEVVTFFDFSSGYIVLDSLASKDYKEKIQKKYEKRLAAAKLR